MAPCVLNISWPQSQSYYYIEVNGTGLWYEITANHTGKPVVNKRVRKNSRFSFPECMGGLAKRMNDDGRGWEGGGYFVDKQEDVANSLENKEYHIQFLYQI
jgi:hypothetical protein